MKCEILNGKKTPLQFFTGDIILYLEDPIEDKSKLRKGKFKILNTYESPAIRNNPVF